jgi:hypothetical protein
MTKKNELLDLEDEDTAILENVGNCSLNDRKCYWSKRKIGGVGSTYGEKSDKYRVLVGSLEERRPLGRPMCRWEDNIKMDLQEVRWGHGLD